MEWYYAKGAQQLGPIDRETLEKLVASGQVRPEDLVWNEGMPNWQPASTVPEINGLIPTQQASAPGPAPYGAPPSHYAVPPQPSFGTRQGPYGAPQGAYGQPQYQQPLPYNSGGFQGAKSYNGLAIGGFVCSLFGLILFFCFGGILGIVGLVLGIVALNGMKSSGNQLGRGLALAAVIIGIVDLAILGLMMIPVL